MLDFILGINGIIASKVVKIITNQNENLRRLSQWNVKSELHSMEQDG